MSEKVVITKVGGPTGWETPDGGPALWSWEYPECEVTEVMEGSPVGWTWKLLTTGDNDIPKGGPVLWSWSTFTCEESPSPTSSTTPI